MRTLADLNLLLPRFHPKLSEWTCLSEEQQQMALTRGFDLSLYTAVIRAFNTLRDAVAKLEGIDEDLWQILVKLNTEQVTHHPWNLLTEEELGPLA